MRIVVLAFTDFPDGSAMGRRTYLLSRGLAQKGHNVEVVVGTRYTAGLMQASVGGVVAHWASFSQGKVRQTIMGRVRARLNSFQLVSELVTDATDWLLLIYPELDRLPHLLAAKAHGVRIAVTYEDNRELPTHPNISERLMYLRGRLSDVCIPRLADLNVAISTSLRDRLQNSASLVSTCLIPVIVDLDEFKVDHSKAAQFRAKWGLGDSPIIAYLGTYWHIEGIANLLEAARELRDRGESFRMVISGKSHPGLPCDNVAKIISDYGMQKYVLETGWLATDEVIAAMSAADVLVAPKIAHPSNIAGLPTKLAEYMAMGRAIVATRVGDIPLYLRDRENAILCAPSDCHSLTEALHLVISDEPLRRRLGANARVSACAFFDYRMVSSQLESAMMAVGRK